MIKSKKNFAIIIICAVLIVMAIIAGVIFFLNSRVSNETLQETITNAWTRETEEEIPGFLTDIESKASFTVVDFVDNGKGHYSVEVEATSPDIYQEIIDYQRSITEIIGTEEIDKQLSRIIEEAELKTTQHTLTVIYSDGEPEVKFTEEFVDAMYGYAYIYSINAIEEILTF